MNWWLLIAKFIAGCGLLAWGADRFIVSSSILAKKMGMSTLMVGMLLVGFGTSFPEIVVSSIAAIHNTPQLAIGNAIGSNIINIGFVLGLAALISPITVHSQLVKRELPILFAVSIIVFFLLSNLYLSRLDGIILGGMLVLRLYWMFFRVPKAEAEADPLVKEFEEELPQNGKKLWLVIFWWFFGLALLFVSSELLVSAAVSIAKWLQVSDLVIGLTVVALGTSLPELAATLMGALRGEDDIAIGNVIGSSIFNLLAVLMMPALIAPTKLPLVLVWRDYPIMIVFTLLMWLLAFFPRGRQQMGRLSGICLLLGFVAYMIWVVVEAV